MQRIAIGCHRLFNLLYIMLPIFSECNLSETVEMENRDERSPSRISQSKDLAAVSSRVPLFREGYWYVT